MSMPVYVLEIDGRAILAMGAMNRDDAEMRVEEEDFRAGLMILETDGMPLWDGSAELFLRDPFPEELAKFEGIRAQESDYPGEIDEEDFVVYLLPLTDPTDDFDDGGEG